MKVEEKRYVLADVIRGFSRVRARFFNLMYIAREIGTKVSNSFLFYKESLNEFRQILLILDWVLVQ